MTVATAIAVELVRFQPENPRAAEMFQALMAAAPSVGVTVWNGNAYFGDHAWLMFWGPGAPPRADALRRHVECGGRVLAFDLAYWHRDRKVRVSFDAAHPQRFVMAKALPTDRFMADGIAVTNEWNEDGPIVIAGLGGKARVQYGADRVDEWEADMMRVCAAKWPKRIIYRPKKADSLAPTWARHVDRRDRIEDVIRGASLVITWHSNVAVDAIRMGIPVVCRDGAAAAVCRSTVDDRPMPLDNDVRTKFLSNLAWFQWAPREAAECWRFAAEMLS